MAGERETLGIWAGDGGEGARFWLQVFSELRNRGVKEVVIVVCDGLKGLDQHDEGADGHAAVHRASDAQLFCFAGRQHRDAIAKVLKPVNTTSSEAAAKDRFEEFAAQWGERYRAIVQLWKSSWAEFVPFLEYDVDVRRVICTTNAIESINVRYRWAVWARGH